MGHAFAKYKFVIIVVLSLLAALALLLSFLGSEPSNSLVETEDGAQPIASERGIVETLLQLRSVSLSGTIFSDPAFIYLRDFGTQIVSEPVGRPNPFAPLSLRPAPATTTTATTTSATSTPRTAPPARR